MAAESVPKQQQSATEWVQKRVMLPPMRRGCHVVTKLIYDQVCACWHVLGLLHHPLALNCLFYIYGPLYVVPRSLQQVLFGAVARIAT
jgi:hypothetical protein